MRLSCLLIVWLSGWTIPAVAQSSSSLDVQLLRAVYNVEAPVFTGTMRVAEASSYPLFVVLPAASALHAYAGDRDYQPPLNLALSEVGAGVLVQAGKWVFKRPRPFRTVPGVEARVSNPRVSLVGEESYSFPSGHSALAFAAATSLSLSYRNPYVVIPSMLWASSVAVARVWHGVHYPGDVLAGAVVGGASALLVHLVAPSLTPEGLRGIADAPPAIVLMIPLR